MEDLKKLWLQYNVSANLLKAEIGRTHNLMGDYSEHIACKHYNGKLFENSHPSADFEGQNSKLYQVKSRKAESIYGVQLNVIRSWTFDYLVVVIYDLNGEIKKVVEMPSGSAKKHSKATDHQGGDIITTSKAFFNDQDCLDITKDFLKITG